MKKIFVLILIASVIFTSCEKFLDVNESQDAPEETTPNYLLPSTLGKMAYTTYNQGHLTSHLTQQMTYTSDLSLWGYRADRWNFVSATRIYEWRNNYYDVAGNASKMLEFAEKEDSQNYIGLAKIMMAFSYLTATDLFGDMPILEAFTGIYNPTYDSQEVVYNEIEKMLNEGIAALNKTSSSDRKLDATADRIYKGDMSKWISFAHAVKARQYLHLGKYNEAIAEIDAAKLNWEEPLFAFDEDSQFGRNPFGSSQSVYTGGLVNKKNYLLNAVNTTFFMSLITAENDSTRLKALTSPGKDGTYYSLPASVTRSELGYADSDFADLYNGYWTSDNSPIIYITTEELQFIEAEVTFETDKARSFDAYIKGIKTNFTRLGLDDKVEAYIGNEKLVAQNQTELSLSHIMVQKYLALYLQPETWADMRRHDYSNTIYPNLEQPRYALDKLNGEWIQRIPYDPETEYVYNPKEIERLGARAENWVAKKIWWVEQATK